MDRAPEHEHNRRETILRMDELVGWVDRWSLWVDELAFHPLDRYEYEGMLECRDRIAENLWRLRTEDSRLDELDARFEGLTINEDGTRVRSFNRAWWRDRLPVDERSREYVNR